MCFLSKTFLFALESPQKLPKKLGREDEECESKGKDELVKSQGSSAENASAEIYEKKLYDTDRAHYQNKRTVFGESREETKPVGTAIKAVEYRGEDEEGEKCGEVINIIVAEAEMGRDIR